MGKNNKMSYKNFLKQQEENESDQDGCKSRNRYSYGWTPERARRWRERRFKETILHNFNNKKFRYQHDFHFIDQRGSDTLFSFADDEGKRHHFLRVRDTTTSEYHLLRVPSDMERVLQALAWTFDMSEEEYAMIEKET